MGPDCAAVILVGHDYRCSCDGAVLAVAAAATAGVEAHGVGHGEAGDLSLGSVEDLWARYRNKIGSGFALTVRISCCSGSCK